MTTQTITKRQMLTRVYLGSMVGAGLAWVLGPAFALLGLAACLAYELTLGRARG